MFFLNVFHFQCAYFKTTHSWVFGFVFGRFMSSELLKLLPIFEVIVIYIKELLCISWRLWLSFLHLQPLRLNFQNRTMANCVFVYACVCVQQRTRDRILTYYALYLTDYKLSIPTKFLICEDHSLL